MSYSSSTCALSSFSIHRCIHEIEIQIQKIGESLKNYTSTVQGFFKYGFDDGFEFSKDRDRLIDKEFVLNSISYNCALPDYFILCILLF